MRKTFCDRCEAECTNGVAIVHMRIVHRSSQGQWVGEDDTRPRELCHTCGESVRKLLGLEVDEREKNDAERQLLRVIDARAT